MVSPRCAEALLLGALFCISAGRPLKLSAKLGAASLFPDAESPYAGDAPLPIFGEKCAEVSVIQQAQLTGYNQVATGLFVPPACTEWSQVVLRFDGAVRGVQFDRFGAVWLAGVEVLRLTTPEPTAKGIRWQALRDITALGPILRTSGTMSLEIPNVVNPTYTGILKVNVTLEFYKLAGGQAFHMLKIVRPLMNWTTPSIFPTGVRGTQTQTNLISNLPRNMMQANLEVFASGHGCEEFWYTNLPDKDAQGGCGGGAYREIEVLVDGMTAGVAYPFPVIYTGGVNPLLWRPLTGIASFDVPPYNIDLSPFLGVLNDGKTHNISLTVRGNSKNGVWYLDPVLHAELDPAATVLTGAVLQHTDTKPPLSVNKTDHGNTSSTYITKGRREVKVFGNLMNPEKNYSWRFLVEHSLDALNHNNLIGADLQVSDGWMRSTSTSTKFDWKMGPYEGVVQKSFFPYYVYDLSAEDKTTFEIGPTKVTYGREVSLGLSHGKDAPYYQLQVSRWINATALYNRSLTNHSLVFKQQGTSEETSGLRAGTRPKSCFSRELSAKNGFTTSQRNTSVTCDWRWGPPRGFYVCGLAFCQQPDGIARSARSYLPRASVSQVEGSVSQVDVFV